MTFNFGKHYLTGYMASTFGPDSELEVVPLWIDGTPAESTKGTTFLVHSAKQGKNVYMAQSADIRDATRAADVALTAFRNWRRTSAYDRQSLLFRAADIFEARKYEAITFQVAETSCEPSWAGFNVKYGVSVMREIASKVTSVCGEIPRTVSEANLCLVFKEPIGPSLLIAP